MRQAVLTSLAAAGLLLGGSLVQAENLQGIYKQALDSDPQLRAAEYAYQAAQESKDQSKAGLLPQVNFSANITSIDAEVTKSKLGTTGDDSYSSNGYTLSLQQPLYHHDSWVALSQADSVVARARAEYDAAQQTLITRVAEAYFNLLAAQDNLDFAQAEKRAIKQQLRQTKQRFEVGLSAITDVHEAQAGYDYAVAQEIAAQNQLDTAREALREITAADYKELAPLSEELPLATPEPADINRWVEKALEQNLSLLAAQAAAETARQEVSRLRAGHYPTLDLVASHQYSDAYEAANGTENNSTSLSLQLNVPLYSGGLTSSRSRQALAQYNQTQEGVVQARRAVVRQTRAAYLGVTAGISQVKASNQALSSAQTALDATQAGFEVGTRTAVDVLNAQQELFRAKRDYSRARYDYILATLQLKQAAGTLNGVDVAEVNRWLD